VKVLSAGFEYEGKTYPSLSAAAQAITGYKFINGYAFFKEALAEKGKGAAA
jgi:hypothetical protein